MSEAMQSICSGNDCLAKTPAKMRPRSSKPLLCSSSLRRPFKDDPRPGKKYKMLMNVIMTSSIVIEQ